MDDEFFDNATTAAQSNVNHNDNEHFVDESAAHFAEEFHQEEIPAVDTHYEHQQVQQDDEDFFGTQPTSTAAVAYQHEIADDFFGTATAQTTSSNYAYAEQSYSAHTFEAAAPQQLSEQDQRKQHLQQEEQERRSKLIQKQDEENAKKRERVQNAKAFLQNWKNEKGTNVQRRKQLALQEEEVAVEERAKVSYRNPWEKIADNINLKVSEHPGEKDVSRIRECILSKKSDLQNQK